MLLGYRRTFDKVYSVIREGLRHTLGLRCTFKKVYVIVYLRRFALSFEKGYVIR